MNGRFVVIVISFVHLILQVGTYLELTKGCTLPSCGTITLPNGDVVALEPKSVTDRDCWWPGMENIAIHRLICKLPDCLSTPCQNGGTCTETLDSFNCTCSGFYGLACEVDVDECSVNPNLCDTTNGVCTNLPGTFNCSCNTGYELDVDGSTCNAKCPDESWLSFQGSCYGYFTNEVNFYRAMSTCRGIVNEQSCQADLVSIHNEDETEFIVNLCLEHPTCSSAGYWIGFYQPDSQGPFVWSDGTLVNYTAWKWPEPNNAGVYEDCALVYRPGSSNTWADDNCYRSTPFICKIPVVCN